jgi:hypothetical protein
MWILFIWILVVVNAKPCLPGLSGRNLVGAYMPQCVDGNWRPVQCWGSTGACWCVDSEGKRLDQVPVVIETPILQLSCS